MARTFQLDPVSGATLDPAHVLLVDRNGDDARRASQVQAVNGLLSQIYDGSFTFPVGSLGAMLVASAGNVAGQITSFACSAGTLIELGQTVVNPTLNWIIALTAVSAQSLSGPLTSGLVLTSAQRSQALTGGITADATWTLSVTTPAGVLTRSTSLLFGHYAHWGRNNLTTPTEAAMKALTSSRLETAYPGEYSFSADAGSNPYCWFSFPDSWGLPVLIDKDTGLPIAIFDAGVVSLTNTPGHTRNFRCLRSLNQLHAAMTVRID